MKKKYDFVFIVLTYRDTIEIEDFLISLKEHVSNYKVIMINSFYNGETDYKLREIAKINNCVFKTVENKGYGYGNNIGIQLAKQLFEYKYLIVSNPDIIITEWIDFRLKDMSDGIIGPCIINKKAKPQNPLLAYDSIIRDKIQFYGFKKNIRILVYFGILISKIQKIFWRNMYNDKGKKLMYAAHGCFLIIPDEVINKIGFPIYDENMFLFCEESYLAKVLRQKGINTYYTEDIKIYHKEDSSMGVANVNTFKETGKSFMYYYCYFFK